MSKGFMPSEYSFLLDKPYNDPEVLVNLPLVVSYLESKEAEDKYGALNALYAKETITLSGSAFYRRISWVDVMAQKVYNGEFFRKDLSDSIMEVLLKVKDISKEIYFVCSVMDSSDARKYYKQNLEYLLYSMAVALKEKNEEDAFKYGSFLEDYVPDLVATQSLLVYNYEKYANPLKLYYDFMDYRWRLAYKNRLKFGELHFRDGSVAKVEYEDNDDIEVYYPYVGFKLKRAMATGRLSEELDKVVLNFKERGLLTKETEIYIRGMGASLMPTRYNHSSFFYVATRHFLAGFPVIPPIPPKIRDRIGDMGKALQRYMTKDNLVNLYVHGYLKAQMSAVLDSFDTYKEELFETLKLNCIILFNHGIITEEEAKNYIQEGKVRYREKD